MEHFNQVAFLFIHQFAGRSVLLDDTGIFLAKYLPYLMGAAFLIFCYYQAGTRRKIYLFCEGAIAVMLSRGIVTEVIRFFYHHQRPFSFYNFTPLIQEAGWSLPSGHMAFFFALATTLWYANRKWGGIYFALTAVVGIARIYDGVHWPYDIIAGAIVGIACGMAIHALLASSRRAIEERYALRAARHIQ